MVHHRLIILWITGAYIFWDLCMEQAVSSKGKESGIMYVICPWFAWGVLPGGIDLLRVKRWAKQALAVKTLRQGTEVLAFGCWDENKWKERKYKPLEHLLCVRQDESHFKYIVHRGMIVHMLCVCLITFQDKH